jgi:hypothetical protein
MWAMPITPPGVSLALRLVTTGIPDGFAALLAEACTLPPQRRAGEAAACVVDQATAQQVVEWLEGQVTPETGQRDAVVAMLGAGAVLFGAEESGRLVLKHVPYAADVLEEMAIETQDDAGEDPMLSVEAQAETLMLKAALERAEAADPDYDHGLYMDESVILPGFLLVPRRGQDAVELNGALVSTPGGLVFVLSDSLLSGATAGLIPPGELEQGSLSVLYDQIDAAVFQAPAPLGGFEPAPGLDFGPSPNGELHAHLDVHDHALVSICLAYSLWPEGRREALLRRFETMVERVAEALRG